MPSTVHVSGWNTIHTNMNKWLQLIFSRIFMISDKRICLLVELRACIQSPNFLYNDSTSRLDTNLHGNHRRHDSPGAHWNGEGFPPPPRAQVLHLVVTVFLGYNIIEEHCLRGTQMFHGHEYAWIMWTFKLKHRFKPRANVKWIFTCGYSRTKGFHRVFLPKN